MLFRSIVTAALAPPTVRRATRPSKRAKQKRLDAKRHRGALKAARRQRDE